MVPVRVPAFGPGGNWVYPRSLCVALRVGWFLGALILAGVGALLVPPKWLR
jgi:hypothetical protein